MAKIKTLTPGGRETERIKRTFTCRPLEMLIEKAGRGYLENDY